MAMDNRSTRSITSALLVFGGHGRGWERVMGLWYSHLFDETQWKRRVTPVFCEVVVSSGRAGPFGQAGKASRVNSNICVIYKYLFRSLDVFYINMYIFQKVKLYICKLFCTHKQYIIQSLLSLRLDGLVC